MREKLAPAPGRERGHARQRHPHARQLRRRQVAGPGVVDREDLTGASSTRRFRETALDLLGPGGQLLRTSADARRDVDWAREFLWSRAGTIYSGSSEIQRNIIAKRVLEPAAGRADEASSSPTTRRCCAARRATSSPASSRSRRSRSVMEHADGGLRRAEWARLAEMGYLGLIAAGARAADRGSAPSSSRSCCEEMGRMCVPGPFLDAVLAAVAARGRRQARRAASRDVVAGQEARDDRARRRAVRGRLGAARSRVDGGPRARHEVLRALRGCGRRAAGRRPPTASALADGAVRRSRRSPTIDPAQRFGDVDARACGDARSVRSTLARARRSARRGRRERHAARHHEPLRSR